MPKVFETQKVEVSSPEVGANVGDLFSNAKGETLRRRLPGLKYETEAVATTYVVG